MQVEIEDISAVEKKLTVTIPAERVQDEVEEVYAEIGKSVRIKGFRPGKVPRPHLERMFADASPSPSSVPNTDWMSWRPRSLWSDWPSVPCSRCRLSARKRSSIRLTRATSTPLSIQPPCTATGIPGVSSTRRRE